MLISRRLLSLIAIASLASCGPIIPEPSPGVGEPVGDTALARGVRAGPSIASLNLRPVDASSALSGFAESCRAIRKREDLSRLTQLSDWAAPCDAAPNWPRNDAARFFARYFTATIVGDGAAFATGYFEPEILGSRTRRTGYEQSVYGMPSDLTRCWRDETPESQREGRAPLSRLTPDGRCVPFYTRAEIMAGALAGRGLEVAWAADPVELFFLQIQGSGRLRTPEGEVIRIGYAGQNGHSYTGIGALMKQRGLIGGGTGYATSMQGIMQYLRDHPVEGAAIMNENDSWVFFRMLEGDGPMGSLGVPVRGESSVAVDPRFVPYGAPVWLDLDRNEADGLWVAQDTGGAIKGANRFDTFWGAGEEARRIAGGMSGRGEALILLPKDAAARLGV